MTKINASRSRQAAKRVAQLGRLVGLVGRDTMRFWKYASLSAFDGRPQQIRSRIMYNVHALEKGLAQAEGWEPGRGMKAIANLNDSLAMYRATGMDEGDYEFCEGLAILRRYRERHLAEGASVDFLSWLVDPDFLGADNEANRWRAGTTTVERPTKNDVDARREAFYALAQGRHSVREYTGQPIDPAAVARAIENAQKTPSVCNRQGWGVHVLTDKTLIETVLRHQRGFRASRLPETLLVVTVNNGSFLSPVERNQGFVDGGLYSMSILYGLEAEGLGAVPLNACLYASARTAIVNAVGIDPGDEIIMFIAVGDRPDTSEVPASDRRPVSAVIV